MARYALATAVDGEGEFTAAIVDGGVHPLPGRPAMGDVLRDWDRWLERIDGLVDAGELTRIGAADEVALRAPLPRPANLYMAGANYADHAREMRDLPPDAEVPKPARGPFMFLKPTTSVIAGGDEVRIGVGAERVDWEVELAVVIGRPGSRVAEADALSVIAGYTVANDISVRGRFVRDDIPEAPMKFDWFSQKGWATSCPMGPWLVPADQLPAAQDTVMKLTVNGEVHQEASTRHMIFSIAEQIAFVSAIVELVPGDVICTGTCAGVGAGKGRFLSPGDLMVAEIEGIGAIANPVVAG